MDFRWDPTARARAHTFLLLFPRGRVRIYCLCRLSRRPHSPPALAFVIWSLQPLCFIKTTYTIYLPIYFSSFYILFCWFVSSVQLFVLNKYVVFKLIFYYKSNISISDLILLVYTFNSVILQMHKSKKNFYSFTLLLRSILLIKFILC